MIEKGICMADGKTGAIILAAGRSAHMEELKPMLRMGQTTMIQREIDTIRQAGSLVLSDNMRLGSTVAASGTAQVAAAAGMTDRQYQRFETGKQKPGFDSLLALADHFGVSLDYLAGRSDRREL